MNNETMECSFKDKCLGKEFRHLLEQMHDGIEETIPFACQDLENTKVAYRFLSNESFNESQILNGHFQATKQPIFETKGPIFVLHDTIAFSYHCEDLKEIGCTYSVPNGKKNLFGKAEKYSMCGILMHGSIAVATGSVLGSTANFGHASDLKEVVNLKIK